MNKHSMIRWSALLAVTCGVAVACGGGHSDATCGYHYHVASSGSSMFIGCFKGQQGSAS